VPLTNQEGCQGMLVLGNLLSRPWAEADVHLVIMAARQIALGM